MVTNTVPITELEQPAFCQEESELVTKPLEEEFKVPVQWQKVPEEYLPLDVDTISAGIKRVKKQLGNRVVMLGHHYQRDEVIQFVDYTGDSFKLSQYAASQEAEYIIFCGVHFMAETADILTKDTQKVILPNMKAGCSMADMASTEDVLDCWSDLSEVITDEIIVPITYMNSTAAIKALCGRNNGIVCTSSNAVKAFQWALTQGSKILFFPDQHLGRNTALKLGFSEEDMLVWNPFALMGGHTAEELKASKIILWKGHCSVHTRFTVKQIEVARNLHPDVQVVVHPECPKETVQSADFDGSTESIIGMVNKSPAGSVWAIGTEINLVHRLAKENPDKKVFCLDPVVCPCSTMYRIHPAYVLWALESILYNNPVNIITVPTQDKLNARMALDRMLLLQ